MRKKLLSLLTVLCLVLSMLPATAMAAEAAADAAAEYGYSEGDIAQYVSEDTEITEDVDGLVLVVAPVTVTVSGAKLSTGLMVAPGAEGAKITLGAEADVNAVIVMATAEVTVEETAVAASVTVTAPETTVTVAGEVKAVNVAEEAVAATVTVAETAKVESVTVAAPDVKVEVAGTVETVTVAETATGAELVVEETAEVGEVTDATGELTVSGDGAESVTVTDASEPAEEEEKKDEDAKDEESEEDVPSFVQDPVVTTPTKPDLIGSLKTAPIGTGNATNYTVTQTDVTTSYTGNNADAVYNVKISAQNVKQTTSSNAAGNVGNCPYLANWVGISIPVDTSGKYSYKVYTLTRWESNKTAADMDAVVFTGTEVTSGGYWIHSDGKVDYTEGNQAYHTVYFPGGDADVYKNNVLWAVGVEVYEKAEESTAAVENAALVWSEIYNITVDISLYNEAAGQSDEENGTPVGDDDSDDDTNVPGSEDGNTEGGDGEVDDIPAADEIVKTEDPAEVSEPAPAPEADAE